MAGNFIIKTMAYVFFAALIVSLTTGYAVAQTKYLDESGWIINNNFPTQQTINPANFPNAPQPPAQEPDPSLEDAWNRVWTPFQDFTGVPRATMEDYVDASKQRFADDSDEMLGNAKAWSVIIADLGFGSVARRAVQDWFSFTATEVPQKLAE